MQFIAFNKRSARPTEEPWLFSWRVFSDPQKGGRGGGKASVYWIKRLHFVKEEKSDGARQHLEK